VGQIDNMAQGNLGDIFRRLRALEHASNQNNMAVGRGGIRVHNGGVITIENGGLVVTGTAEIIGSLIASGTIDFTGDVNISGPLDVSGLVTLMSDLVVASGGKITAGSIELNPDGSAKFGTMTISPAGKITSGSAEINPDGSAKFGTLQISSTGKITSGTTEINPDGSAKFGDTTISFAGVIESGNTLIDPDDAMGGFTFNSGGGVGGNGGVVAVRGSGNAGLLTGTTAALFAGSTQVTVANGSVRFDGLPTVTGVEPNVYLDPSTGSLKRIV
jgi:hypothetical protein